jgi:hypothetical protein
MEHMKNQNIVALNAINDKVFANGYATKPWAQVIATPA